MPLYRLSNSIISRSKGKSAVAAAAYRSGSILKDDRLNVVHDYSRKENIAWTMILAPKDAPSWIWNREQLWNQVEATETRKDSQLARECLLALPTELSLEQQVDLVKHFSTDQFVQHGMVADLALHSLEKNPHVHILLTMRELNEDGFGLKNRDWNQRSWLKELRKSWADYCNTALESAGIEERLDHRSLAAQGIDRIPQIHLGSHAAKCLKEGIYHPRVERYLEIEELNSQLKQMQAEAAETAHQIQVETQRQSKHADLVLPIAKEVADHYIAVGSAIACGKDRWGIKQGDYQIFLAQPSEVEWELEIWSGRGQLVRCTEQEEQQTTEIAQGLNSQDVQNFSRLQQALQMEQQRLQREQAEHERLEREQQERERLEHQRLEQERLEKLCQPHKQLYDLAAGLAMLGETSEQRDLRVADEIYQVAIAKGLNPASVEQRVQLTIGYGGATGQAILQQQGITEALQYAQTIALQATENWQQDQASQILDTAIDFFKQQAEAGQVIERQPNELELKWDRYTLVAQLRMTETGQQRLLSIIDSERGELARCRRLLGLDTDEWQIEVAQNIQKGDAKAFEAVAEWLQQQQVTLPQQRSVELELE